MAIKERGKLVVVEGGVGAGKSWLLYTFKQNHDDWRTFREPGATQYGELVREAVQRIGLDVAPTAAMLGYSSARANLVEYGILPALKRGENVVLDRYWFSTLAYQGAEGVGKLPILIISWLATGGLLPDLTVFLDLDPKIGLRRKEGAWDTDRYDVRHIDFHNIVRRNYHQLGLFIPRWVTLDASKPADEVYRNFETELKRRKII